MTVSAIDGLGHGVSAEQQRETGDREGNISKDLTLKTPEKLLGFHKYTIKANCQGSKGKLLFTEKTNPAKSI